jgi:hypothetical protein
MEGDFNYSCLRSALRVEMCGNEILDGLSRKPREREESWHRQLCPTMDSYALGGGVDVYLPCAYF